MIEFLSSKLLPKLIEKLVLIQTKRSDELQNISDVFGDCEKLAKHYVEPNCQHGNPADEDDIASPISVPIFQVLNKILNRKVLERDGRHQLFVLADAGMGKTSLLVMIKYFNLCSFWPQGYDCKLLKLGSNTISEIVEIKNKSNTVLLLDALDEDPFAWKDYESRVRDILRESINFRNVIITCRTQFFPTGEKDPFHRSGMINFLGYTCPVIYLSLFDDNQVEKYLISSLGYGSEQILEAQSLLTRMRTLKSRPLLLAHMQDLIESKENFDNTYGVYYSLVQAWINREKRKNDSLQINVLWLACLRIAIEMTLRKERNIAPLDIDKLRVKYKEIADINRVDIGGRSLLNRNSYGSYRFSHYSIQEFLVAEAIIRGLVEYDQISSLNLTADTINHLHDYNDSFFSNTKDRKTIPGANWSESNVIKKKYKNCILVATRAFNAKMSETEILNSNLYLSNFRSTKIDSVSFDNSNLSQCNFSESTITNCSFKETIASQSSFLNCICNSVAFNSAYLRSSNFTESIVSNCNFKGADLLYAKFDKANLTGSDFRGCTNLSPSQLENALVLDYVKLDEKIQEILIKNGVLQKHKGF